MADGSHEPKLPSRSRDVPKDTSPALRTGPVSVSDIAHPASPAARRSESQNLSVLLAAETLLKLKLDSPPAASDTPKSLAQRPKTRCFRKRPSREPIGQRDDAGAGPSKVSQPLRHARSGPVATLSSDEHPQAVIRSARATCRRPGVSLQQALREGGAKSRQSRAMSGDVIAELRRSLGKKIAPDPSAGANRPLGEDAGFSPS
jgi:hypothetical protein